LQGFILHQSFLQFDLFFVFIELLFLAVAVVDECHFVFEFIDFCGIFVFDDSLSALFKVPVIFDALEFT